MAAGTFYLKFDTGRDTGYAAWRGWSGSWWACGDRGNAYVFPSAESARSSIASVAHTVIGVPPNCWQVHALVDGGQTAPWNFDAERPADPIPCDQDGDGFSPADSHR